MKTHKIHLISLAVILFFTVNPFIFGQITSTSSSGRNDSKPEESLETEKKVNDLFNKSGFLFKEGLTALSDNRRSIAGEKFDKSIEIFLMSDVNIQLNQKLRECYNQLIETVYRIEFPSDDQLPQVRSLSATCNWDIKNETADNIAKIIKTQPANAAGGNDLTAATANGSQPDQTQVGFNEQKFEASPIDDLQKLPVRERKIALKKSQPLDKTTNNYAYILPDKFGAKPIQQKDGRSPIVIKYIYDNFHNPYSVIYLNWTQGERVKLYDQPFWMITVKLRAKNMFNAYRLTTIQFIIKNNKVIAGIDIGDKESAEIIPYLPPSNPTLLNAGGSPASSSTDMQVLVYSSQNNYRVVTTKAGDSLTRIAEREGVSLAELAKFNGLLTTSALPIGREIKIPSK